LSAKVLKNNQKLQAHAGEVMNNVVDRERLVPPALTEKEASMVKAAERLIMTSLHHSKAATITIESDDGSSPSVAVPPAVLRMLGQTLGMMAKGQPIVLVPEKQEFSTVEAANFLNVSRPFVIKEIQAGKLAHRMVGSHRRVLFKDLVQYAESMRMKRSEALDKMAENARELGLEY
jgi:excisionase family DNA binding protein